MKRHFAFLVAIACALGLSLAEARESRLRQPQFTSKKSRTAARHYVRHANAQEEMAEEPEEPADSEAETITPELEEATEPAAPPSPPVPRQRRRVIESSPAAPLRSAAPSLIEEHVHGGPPGGYHPSAPEAIGDGELIEEAPCDDNGCLADSCTVPCPPCHDRYYVARHRSGIFGEYLYLDAKGTDVSYAQPRDGLDPATSVPVGATGVVLPSYHSGYRVGFSAALGACSSVVGTFTSYASRASNDISTDVPNSLFSLVAHPSTNTAASNSLVANAKYDIDFRLADVDYRAVIAGGPRWVLNYNVGARYGHLDQDLLAQQPIAPGITSVNTNIDFDGGGPRIGLDGERHALRRGVFVYGRAFASFLAGRFTADYTQFNTFALTQAATSWRNDRIVPVLEYEAGIGWASRRGGLRLSAGYYVAAWYNTVTTPEWIQAVQNSNFTNVGNNITFDGLVTKAELRW